MCYECVACALSGSLVMHEGDMVETILWCPPLGRCFFKVFTTAPLHDRTIVMPFLL